MQTKFRYFCKITIASIIFLIFVGGIVRATGSGMGCPDWPKCFGMWVPPTSVGQLPINYQEIYGAKLKGEIVFNPVKTWIEYVNRLVGVMVGLFIFITLIYSMTAYWKTNKSIVFLSFVAWILVLLEGWLGAKVVSSELHPVMITIHMFLSVIILGLLILAYLRSENSVREYLNLSGVSFLIIVAMILTSGQIIFGTQLREAVDLGQKTYGDLNRNLWLSDSRGKVVFHASLSIFLLAINFFIYLRLKESYLKYWATRLLALTLISIISGALLGFFGMPAFCQPIHLVMGVGIISLQFVLFFYLKPRLIHS